MHAAYKVQRMLFHSAGSAQKGQKQRVLTRSMVPAMLPLDSCVTVQPCVSRALRYVGQ